MRTHSRTKPRPGGGSADSRAQAPTSFLEAWDQLGGPADLPPLPRRRGRKPRVPLRQLLPALTFHVMHGAGTLAQHFDQLFGVPLSDSSWSARRTRLPWDVFADLLRRMLRPLATGRRHPEAFWRGWRLVALDGTQFSLPNTPQITATVPKAKTRRGRAAFAKLPTVALVELGLHNPLAAAIGRPGQSEWELACGLVAQVTTGMLVLADRLYGCGAFAAQALAVCTRVGSHFLLRARSDIKPGVVERLADGSRLVVVAVRDPTRPSRIVDWLHLREIRVRVKRPGHRGREVRLWTSLLDPKTAPALELAELYARRWEHELYYRELKRELRKTDLLQSHTVETAAQEIAALVVASALLATERARAARGTVPALRVSFVKVLALVPPLWLMLSLLDDLISEDVKAEAVKRIHKQLRRCVTPKRRARSCPRAVRQPIKGWPRLLRNQSVEGPLHFTLR
jgi:hypothetical protein